MLKHPATWPKPYVEVAAMRNLQPRSTPVYDSVLRCYRYRLPHGKDLLIDEDDLWLLPLANWRCDKKTDHVASVMVLHRLVMRAERGQEIDHRHGNRSDARKSELRVCTTRQNCRSRGKNRHANQGVECTSRFKGVHQRFDTGRFQAYIKLSGKLRVLGYFASEIEAAKAYDAACTEHFGEFGKTNESLGLYGNVIVDPSTPVSDDQRYVTNRGIEFLVDAEDRWMADASSWSPHHKKRYIHSRVMIHRLIMRAKPGEIIDHKEGNPLDNRKCMLRRCTVLENGKNRGKHSRKRMASSRFKGVCFDSSHAKLGRPSCWMAAIRKNGKHCKLGRHRTEEAAARAYDAAALKYHGEFSRTNVDLGLLPPLS